MGRFDPVEGKPYGKCNDCGIEVADKEESSDHLAETFAAAKAEGGSKSHSVSVLNADRVGRISNEVSRTVDAAIENAMDDLWRLVDSGDASEGEIEAGLAFHSEFRDAWREVVEASSE